MGPADVTAVAVPFDLVPQLEPRENAGDGGGGTTATTTAATTTTATITTTLTTTAAVMS